MLLSNASDPLPSGVTNPWPRQTGSMRVRGQLFIAYFYFFLHSHSIYFHHFPLRPPLFLPCWRFPIKRHWTFLTSAAEHISGHHLFLRSPLPGISCCPIWCCLSSCQYLCPMCFYHLATVTSICSCHCSSHDVTKNFVHPACLVSVSHSPLLLMFDGDAPSIKCCQYDSLWCDSHSQRTIEVWPNK